MRKTLKTLGVVLAAGESKRFGSHKLLAILNGKPLILHPVLRLLSSQTVDEVLVILGYNAVRVAKIMRGLGVRTFFNPGYKEGMASSVRVAAALALASGYDAVVLTPGDTPYPYTNVEELLKPLRGCYEASRPICRGKPGFPVALSRSALREALSLTGDVGLRRKLASMRLHLVTTMEPCDVDIDTPGDLENARIASASQHQKPSSQPPDS